MHKGPKTLAVKPGACGGDRRQGRPSPALKILVQPRGTGAAGGSAKVWTRGRHIFEEIESPDAATVRGWLAEET